MTVTQTALGGPWLLRPRAEQGVSDDAKKLNELFDNALAFAHSVSMGDRFRGAVSALREAYEEASSADWDGYGGQAADPFNYIHALSLVSALPSTAPLPEIAVDPDGEVEFEWCRGPRWIFTVSIGKTGALSYAGIFGRNKVYGVEQLTEGLPEAIVQNIRRLLGPEARVAKSGAG